jgi:disulfide bond formation protein DsbB
MDWKKKIDLTLHLCFYGVLILVLFGGYCMEFIMKHEPCALCYLQRLGMVLASLCLLINLKHPSSKSLGVCLLSSLFGAFVALRHNSLKFCCGGSMQPQILGKSLPTWAFYVFGCSMIAVALLLLVNDRDPLLPQKSTIFRVAFVFISLALLVGILSTLLSRGCGF